MALRRFNAEAPVRTPLVDRITLLVALRWLQWFQDVGDRLQAVSVLDVADNPPSIVSGALRSVAVSFPGVRRRDFVKGLSFEPMTAGGSPVNGIQLFGTINQDGAVLVSFWNVSGGTIDLDAGTLRIEVERVT